MTARGLRFEPVACQQLYSQDPFSMLCPVHPRGRRPPPTLRRDHHRFHRVLTNISMVRLANYRHLLSLCLLREATNSTNILHTSAEIGDRKHMNRPHIMINCSSWAWGGNAPDICVSVQKVEKVQLQVRRITVGCVRPRRGLEVRSAASRVQNCAFGLQTRQNSCPALEIYARGRPRPRALEIHPSCFIKGDLRVGL